MPGSIEGVAKATKEVCQAVLWLLVIALVLSVLTVKSCRTRIPEMAREAGIEEISDKGVKFRKIEEQVQRVVTNAVNGQVQQQVGSAPKTLDVRPDPQTKELLISTQQLQSDTGQTSMGEFWAYLGEYDFSSRRFAGAPTFNVTEPQPPQNKVITAATDVYERRDPPRQDASGKWQLGTIIGVLREGKPVIVRDSRQIEGETSNRKNIWLLVSPAP